MECSNTERCYWYMYVNEKNDYWVSDAINFLNLLTLNVITLRNQRTNGPVNAHLISWPSKAKNIQNLEKYMVKKWP